MLLVRAIGVAGWEGSNFGSVLMLRILLIALLASDSYFSILFCTVQDGLSSPFRR